MEKKEIQDLFNDEAQLLYQFIDEYINQKRLSIHAFEEKTKLSRLKKNKTASLSELRLLCLSSLIVAKDIQYLALDLRSKIEEFETKGTFQTSIK